MTPFSIEGRVVGGGAHPLLVAEMSGNHNQSLERAFAIVDAAADAGAHALKIQTYNADTVTVGLSANVGAAAAEGAHALKIHTHTANTVTLHFTEGAFRRQAPASLWRGKSLYELYKEAYTPWDWHGAIFERARSRGMIGFSSP